MQSEEDLSLSNQLYYILVMTVKEKALQKLKTVQDTNGLEARRCFHLEWEPMKQGRFTAMLMGILNQEFTDLLVPSIGIWERAVLTYNQQNK